MPKLTTAKFESDFSVSTLEIQVNPEGVVFSSDNHLEDVCVCLNKKSVLELIEFLQQSINEIQD